MVYTCRHRVVSGRRELGKVQSELLLAGCPPSRWALSGRTLLFLSWSYSLPAGP